MLEPPIKVPQHCNILCYQEHYASGAANGRNVAHHRDNNTIPSLLRTYKRNAHLTSVAIRCLPANPSI
jgi:hypothetical protein